MPDVLYTRHSVVLAKVESVYGSDSLPVSASDAIEVYDLAVKPTGETVERAPISASLSPRQIRRGMKSVDVTFKTELRGTGNAGVLPAFGWEGCLFRACGMSEAINAGSSIVYAPVSQSFESVTIYAYISGLLHKIIGCRGSFSIDMEVGKQGFVSWKLQGIYARPTDTPLVDPDYNELLPPIFVNSQFTIGGFAAVLTKVNLDINNTLAMRRSINAETGLVGIEVTGRKPQGSFDPEATLEADEDFWAKWETAEAIALAIGPVGSEPGNIIEISAPKVQYRDLGTGDRDGVVVYEVPISLARDLGDDELSISFS